MSSEGDAWLGAKHPCASELGILAPTTSVFLHVYHVIGAALWTGTCDHFNVGGTLDVNASHVVRNVGHSLHYVDD